MKKINVSRHVKKFFFLSNDRNDEYYVWWDINLQEAVFLKYDENQ